MMWIMKKLLALIIIGALIWYGVSNRDHYLQLAEETVVEPAHPQAIQKCTTKDGRVIYGDPPQGVKCATREPVKGNLTIVPSENFQTKNPKTVAAKNALDGKYHCDGRTHCSHMKSCEEAEFFLKNCPTVSMDGDNDGIPCEQQWCNK